jgi:hypothetical protein
MTKSGGSVHSLATGQGDVYDIDLSQRRSYRPLVTFSIVAFTLAWHFGHSTVRVWPFERVPVMTQPRSHALLSALHAEQVKRH